VTAPPNALVRALADRYRLERELGQGGMATVYLAEDVKHRRKVAVKVLRPELAAALGAERFTREIEIGAQLQHPHILPLLDSGEAQGFFYYVMPYVNGESLRERLVRVGELPVHQAVKLLCEIVDALSHAHSHGVVHRDMKPDNVMLSGRHALVMDFGVAKAVSEATGRQTLTTAGVALGTPAYMAPEQATADPHLDHRVDIYAVGVLAYELLAGRPPFAGASPQQVLAAHVTQAPDPVATRRPSISPALADIVMKCLAKRPADRWQTADELLAQLEPLNTPSGGMTPASTRPIDAVAAPARGLPRWLGWILGGALVAGGAFALSLAQRAPAALIIGKRTAVAVSPAWEGWPSLSPDGKTIAYTLTDPRTSRLFIQQVDGGSPVPLGDTAGSWSAAGQLSPDGTRILFLRDDGLYTMQALGGQARLVVPRDSVHGQPLWGAWAPDGRRIAYSAGDTLFTHSLDGLRAVALASGDELHSPAWSPDGRWIAFVEGNANFHINGNTAPSSIRVVPAGGGRVVNVTDRGSLNTCPVWVPGKRALLFVSDRQGGRDIYQVFLGRDGAPAGDPVRITTGLGPDRLSISADGRRLAWSVYSETTNIWSLPIPARDSVPLSEAQPVTTGTQNIEQVEVSRDGTWLYFDSNRGGSMDLWRQPLAGGAPQQLTTDSTDEFAPIPSPDGRELAFHSFRDGHRSVFVMPAAGGVATQVSTSSGDNRLADWSPDGQSLLWTDAASPDSSIWVAHRKPDRSWERPVRLYAPQVTSSAPHWTPDGRISFMTDSGIRVLDLRSGARPLVIPGLAVSWYAWADDGRSLFAAVVDSVGRLVIASAAVGGKPKTLVYGDHPLEQQHRFGFAVHGGRFYVPIVDRKADVWVAEVEGR